MSGRNGKGNIHTVTADDPPFLFHRGEGYTRHRLPVGTKVIYPNAPLDALPDRRAAIEHAIDHPLGTDPLDALLRAGMKVTIAFDDVSLPLPRMQAPDIRQSVMEVVLERLDRAGVTDVELICAICLHRRCTPAEIKHFVGPAIFKRFWPDRLYNHDAEDPKGNLMLGTTSKGEVVEINRRAAESDLLIYVNINLVTMDGGHKSVPVGLATYRCVRHHHNAHMMLHDSSYMDPPNSAFHRSCERMGEVVAKQVKIFTIETTLNGDTFHNLLGFLQHREHAWNLRDRLMYHGSRLGMAVLPGPLRRKAYSSLPAPYGLTGVHAGATDAVHQRTLSNIDRQHEVEVPNQFDIVLIGLPSIGPYNVNSILNPILVQCLSTGYFFNFYRNRPLVRRGGVMIIDHPIENKFNKLHHPSYYDFFNDLLSQTRDPAELERRFEKSYAENERYIDLYRRSYAYHGVHPFYMWYWGAHGMAHMGKVIAVAPKSVETARRIGFDIAPSMDAAIGMARDFIGGDATTAYYHCPPVIMCKLPA
ncbi:MAG: lactate racemase domain-containing protein [Planctomycetota bacterium]